MHAQFSHCSAFHVYLHLHCMAVDLGMYLSLQEYYLMNTPHCLYQYENNFPSLLRAAKVNT